MDRTEQQAAGTHPAPCARHCEANAFQIEIRGLKAAHASAVEAGKKLAQQALKAERERDAIAAELKALREQGPVARIDDDENFQGPCRHAMAFVPMHRGAPLYAHPVPARELTDAIIGQIYIKAAAHIEHATQREIAFARAIERHLRGDAP